MNPETTWKVTTFCQNPQGGWENVGEGYAFCAVDKAGPARLCVLREEDASKPIGSVKQNVLEAKIIPSFNYALDIEASVIKWNEVSKETSSVLRFAMKFQDQDACKELWEHIREVLQLFEHADGPMPFPGSDDHQLDAMSMSTTSGNSGFSDCCATDSCCCLPEVTMGNLGSIANEVCCVSLFRTGEVVRSLLAGNAAYIQKLFDVFNECEDLDSSDDLRTLFMIFKGILELRDKSLIKLLVADNYFMQLVGVLEYNPVLKEKADYRDFFTEKLAFKEVVPIQNSSIVQKVHENFRIQAINDNILQRALDDPTIHVLNEIVQCNKNDILSHLGDDKKYITGVVEILRSSGRLDGVFLLWELFLLTKPSQSGALGNGSRDVLVKTISDVPMLFEAMTHILCDSRATVEEVTKLLGVLSAIAGTDPDYLRGYVSHTDRIHPPKPTGRPNEETMEYRSICELDHSSLLAAIIHCIVECKDQGVVVQAQELLRMILEVDPGRPGNDKFLGVFYEYYITWLIQPLLKTAVNPAELQQLKTVQYAVCELLTSCVRVKHGHRIKYFVLQNNVFTLVMKLFKYDDKFLQLSAMRFIRACVGTGDNFYFRNMVRNAVLTPVYQKVFQKNISRDNMLNSAVLELTEHIRERNFKILIEHICDKFSSVFENVEYVKTFEQLLQRYEQNREDEQLARTASAATGASCERECRAFQSDEDESYFNEDDKEGENTPPQAQAGEPGTPPTPPLPLVAYDDDESGDDDGPPGAPACPATNSESVPTAFNGRFHGKRIGTKKISLGAKFQKIGWKPLTQTDALPSENDQTKECEAKNKEAVVDLKWKRSPEEQADGPSRLQKRVC